MTLGSQVNVCGGVVVGGAGVHLEKRLAANQIWLQT